MPAEPTRSQYSIQVCSQADRLTITTEVENFPGYPNGVDGTQMMMDMKEQATRFGAEMRDGSIVKADFRLSSIPSYR